MNKTVILFSMNNLPNEVILYISNFLDDFHKIQFAYTSKLHYALLYDEQLQNNIDKYFANMILLKNTLFSFIRRINTDGVIYGECEQCLSKKLLYTHFDGETEKCICIDNCHGFCLSCSSYITFHNSENGCPKCFNDLDLWYLAFRI